MLPQLGGEGGGCLASPRFGISHGGVARGWTELTPKPPWPLCYAFAWLWGIITFFHSLLVRLLCCAGRAAAAGLS